MTEEPTMEESLQSEPSGTALKDISEEQKNLLGKAQEGRRLNGDESLELYLATVEAGNEADAAREASEAKDAEIADLKARLSAAEKTAGTRPYLMIDGIIGFENAVPTYGVGITFGTRLGNHLMIELGTDYTIGRFENGMTIQQFSIDSFEFRASIGWMF